MDEDAAVLREMIESLGMNFDVSRFRTGEEFLAFLSASPQERFDIVFMDVYLGGMTGVETARALRKADNRAEIVFTTTSTDHALDGYSVNAAQYLVKPLTLNSLEDFMRGFMRRFDKTRRDVCRVTVNRLPRDILFGDIMYAEVQGKRCAIHTTTETITIFGSIDDLAAMLVSDRFLRCHRSYIVNFEYVKEIKRDFIMKNGERVYIRKGGVKACLDAYKSWLLDFVMRDRL